MQAGRRSGPARGEGAAHERRTRQAKKAAFWQHLPCTAPPMHSTALAQHLPCTAPPLHSTALAQHCPCTAPPLHSTALAQHCPRRHQPQAALPECRARRSGPGYARKERGSHLISVNRLCLITARQQGAWIWARLCSIRARQRPGQAFCSRGCLFAHKDAFAFCSRGCLCDNTGS